MEDSLSASSRISCEHDLAREPSWQDRVQERSARFEYLLAQSSSGLPKVFAAAQLDCKKELTSGAKSYDPLTFRGNVQIYEHPSRKTAA